MSGFPGISRVTDSMVSGSILNSLQRNLQQMAASERSIATGRSIGSLGDAPLAARRTVGWERLLERNQQYGDNITAGMSRLSATESSLAELEEMIVHAREIALGQVQSTATEGTRQNAAVEVTHLVEEAISLANRQFGDRFLFGGDDVSQAPFSRVGTFVSYGGDATEGKIEIAQGMLFAAGISGVRAFGGFSASLPSSIDLDPNLSLDTPVSLLNDGRGIGLGRIEVRDGSGGTETIDLTGVKTIGDTLDRINASGFVTAALDASRNGISLSMAGADLSVTDLNGGTAARDLGIAQLSAGPSLGGDDLDPSIRPLTRVSLLRDGLGVDPDGFTIQNGNLSAGIDLTGVETVEQLLNAVNTAGVGALARITADGRRIEIVSSLAGADLRVIEGTGQSGAQLGFIIPTDQLPLAQMHGGFGVPSVPGSDFRVTAGDGTGFDVDVTGAITLADVVDRINTHPDNVGVIFAEVVAGEDRLRLRDLTLGPDELRVESRNGSFAASGLRIDGSSTGGILEGEPLEPGGIRTNSAFDGFALLARGLQASDVPSIESALRALDGAHQRILDARAEVGSRVRRLEISERRNQLESLETQEWISLESDTDLAEAIVKFNRQQTLYQAALQTSASLMQQSILDYIGI